jgi:hypothetical protein
MDPDANITRQRELAAEITRVTDGGSDTHREALLAGSRAAFLAVELAELVIALDEWRLQGGYDPYGVPQ